MCLFYSIPQILQILQMDRMEYNQGIRYRPLPVNSTNQTLDLGDSILSERWGRRVLPQHQVDLAPRGEGLVVAPPGVCISDEFRGWHLHPRPLLLHSL